MRLIDADVFESYIDCGHLRSQTELCFSELDVVRMLDRQPVVDAVKVRHGYWIEVRDRFNYCMGVKCSKCGRRVKNGGENFCPKCGAMMDGGTNDEKT